MKRYRSIYVEDGLVEQVRAAAKVLGMSWNAFVVGAIERELTWVLIVKEQDSRGVTAFAKMPVGEEV